MQKLIEAGLLGDGLVAVNKPELIDRYNNALAETGLPKTTLSSFQVDGIGWSPEVAAELGNPSYLSVGAPNQVGIIISPDQGGKPIYLPFYSFHQDLIEVYFARFAQEIADVTRRSCIVLDMDQGMTDFESPLDLLLTTQFIVRSSAGKLAEAAREQQDVVSRFMEDDETWFDPDIRQQLIASSRKHGDLRYRKVTIPDMRFDNVRDFYTRAFGGAYVFRSHGSPEILVLEDASLSYPAKRRALALYSITNTRLLHHLHECGLLQIDMAWYHENPTQMQYLHDCLVDEFLCRSEPDLGLTTLSLPQRKKMLLARKADAPEVIFELERLMRRLKKETLQTGDIEVTSGLGQALMHPSNNTTDSGRRVLWQLIAGFQPWNVHRRYMYRRNEFVSEFQTWPVSKQDWAVALITGRHRRHSDLAHKEA